MLKNFVKTLMHKLGFEIFFVGSRYSEDGLFSVHDAGFRNTPEFRAAYQRGIDASNGVDPGFRWRIHNAIWSAKTALQKPGVFVECGVNAGFVSSAILSALNWNSTGRTFYLIDTWEGPPLEQYSHGEIEEGRLAAAEAAMAAGAYVTSFERVQQNFSEWDGVRLLRGAVPEVLQQFDAEMVAFLHIDMNSAAPEVAAVEFFWPRMSPGGIVLLDDYAADAHQEQKLAMDRLADKLGANILTWPTGQGLIIKDG